MATETDSGEVPRSTSRYRTLRGKSISSPRVLDIFRDSSGSQDSSPLRRLRASSVHSMRGFKAENNAPDVPPLPSYALTPKPINIPPPPTFKNRDDLKRPESAAQTVASREDLQEPFHSEPYENHPSPTQQPKTKPKLLGFGKKDLAEAEPLPPAPVYMDPEVQHVIAEQKKQDLARLQATLSTPPPKHKSSLLSLFSRGKKALTPTIAHPDTPSSIATTVFTSRANSLETASNPDSIKFLDSVEKMTSPSTSTPSYTPVTHMQPSFERVSNDTLVPGFTANANGKRVAVRCQSSTINLPVTLETNSVDILLMASTMMRHHINPGTSVVVESYLMLGLERRLRRYERIRDVMNSWDKDHENSLLILTCPASMTDHDLDIDAVPNVDDSPSGFSLQLYQSSRPGKWNKRWVTLLENGQMFVSKTADALPGDPSTTMLCHMSESDIYSPKEAEMRQSLKPPKQFCYAIKSQQRSAVFPDEDNFVHFFSTDNEEVATQFYESVHRWRSWHLVSRKLALDHKLNAPAPQITFDSNNGSDTSCDDTKLDSEPSSGTSSFRIGSFQPLIDMDNISKLAEEARKLLPKPTPSKETKKETYPPEPDFPPPATPVSKGNTPQPAKSGLAQSQTDKGHGSSPGQTYTSSPASQAGSKMENLGSSPATGSLSLEFDALNFEIPEEKPEPKSWFPSAAEHTAKLRKDEPPPVFRRPATADPAVHGSQRRANPNLSIKTHFLEPPRPFDNMGSPSPRGSPNVPFIYRLPGTPMMSSAPPPKGGSRPMLRSGTANLGPAPPPPNGNMRPRSRSMAGGPHGRRPMPENMPPVPALPNRPMTRDAPMAPTTTAPVSVQPRRPMPQRGPPLPPFPARQI